MTTATTPIPIAVRNPSRSSSAIPGDKETCGATGAFLVILSGAPQGVRRSPVILSGAPQARSRRIFPHPDEILRLRALRALRSG